MTKERTKYTEKIGSVLYFNKFKKKINFVWKEEKCEYTNSFKYFYYILYVNIIRKT